MAVNANGAVLPVSIGAMRAENQPQAGSSKQLPKLEASHADEAATSISVHSVKSIMRENHGTTLCSPGEVLTVFVAFLAVVAVVVLGWVLQTEIMEMARAIQSLGLAAHLLFLLLYLWAGTCLGAGWTLFSLVHGIAYGWVALIPITFHTIVSALFGYYMANRCCSAWVARKVARLGRRKRLYLLAASSVLQMPKAGLLMQVILRLSPTPFGLINSVLGIWGPLPLFIFALSTVLGHLPQTVMMISLGRVLNSLGSLDKALASSTGKVNVGLQLGFTSLCIVFSMVFVRYLSVKVLPGMISDEATVSVEDADYVGLSVQEQHPAATVCSKAAADDTRLSESLQANAMAEQVHSIEATGDLAL
eukprot:TRINITY_DN72042_c0_g1_i1.p1 TRINITY_DN72042_c0_g1~~TRINITY_DN72042_c0_g1_i1.p1  ORF type:complete len:371 (-),score=54.96 TRINITY_DN72042_c0_g1_i1:145-1230(-)